MSVNNSASRDVIAPVRRLHPPDLVARVGLRR